MDFANLWQTFPWLLLGARECALRSDDLLQSVLGAPFYNMDDPSFADKADQNKRSSIVFHLLMRAALVEF